MQPDQVRKTHPEMGRSTPPILPSLKAQRQKHQYYSNWYLSLCCFLRRHLYHSWIQECYMCICCDWSLQKTERKGLGKAAAWKKQPRRQRWWIGESGREKKAVQMTSEFSSWKIPSKDDWCPCHPLSTAGSALHSQVPHFYLDSSLVQLLSLSERFLKNLDSSGESQDQAPLLVPHSQHLSSAAAHLDSVP